MIVSGELERSDILKTANLASALRTILKSYETSHKLSNHRDILGRGKQLIGYILAGSLRSPREEVQRLIPEGAGLYESVRAYGYAKQSWPDRHTNTWSDEGMFSTLKLYAQCIDNIQSGKPYEIWGADELKALSSFIQLLKEMETTLIGELNSRRAADLIQEYAY